MELCIVEASCNGHEACYSPAAAAPSLWTFLRSSDAPKMDSHANKDKDSYSATKFCAFVLLNSDLLEIVTGFHGAWTLLVE
jgi:hypothetical protein